MADSPHKLPQLSDPELKGLQKAAQLACYHCRDTSVSREALERSVHEAFQGSLEAIEKRGRQLRAAEQKLKYLQKQLEDEKTEIINLKKKEKLYQDQLAAAQQKIEDLEDCAVFYSDDKRDAITQTEDSEDEAQHMSWQENDATED